jgi:hypothetical protein
LLCKKQSQAGDYFLQSNKSGSGSPTRLIKNGGSALEQKLRGTTKKSKKIVKSQH